MPHITGQLRFIPDTDRLGVGDCDLHCGASLDLLVQGHWLRGRVELSDRLGWYWTDNHVSIPLRPGLQARVTR